MKRLKPCYYLLVIVPCFLSLIIITACGRRGDPVLTAPYEEPAVEKAADEEETKKPLIEKEPEVIGKAQPDAPSGLVAVYTGNSVVLAWDEMVEQGVKQYRVYRRSEDDDYSFIGNTVTPAFTDSDIEPDKEYYYKITASGASEGPASEELKVITKDN